MRTELSSRLRLLPVWLVSIQTYEVLAEEVAELGGHTSVSWTSVQRGWDEKKLISNAASAETCFV